MHPPTFSCPAPSVHTETIYKDIATSDITSWVLCWIFQPHLWKCSAKWWSVIVCVISPIQIWSPCEQQAIFSQFWIFSHILQFSNWKFIAADAQVHLKVQNLSLGFSIMVLLYFPIPRCIKLCQLFGYVPGTRKLMNPDITNDSVLTTCINTCNSYLSRSMALNSMRIMYIFTQIQSGHILHSEDMHCHAYSCCGWACITKLLTLLQTHLER